MGVADIEAKLLTQDEAVHKALRPVAVGTSMTALNRRSRATVSMTRRANRPADVPSRSASVCNARQACTDSLIRRCSLRRSQPHANLDGFDPDSLRRAIERARNAFAVVAKTGHELQLLDGRLARNDEAKPFVTPHSSLHCAFSIAQKPHGLRRYARSRA